MNTVQQFVKLFNKSPKQTIAKLDELVVKGYVKAHVNEVFPELTVYNYSEHTTFERRWDIYTMMCRGLVIDKEEQKIVGLPFAKFFNLDELKQTEQEHLSSIEPTQQFDTFMKMDGSLGIGFIHKNTLIWCTRGNFNSEQAVFANKYIRELYSDLELHNGS